MLGPGRAQQAKRIAPPHWARRRLPTAGTLNRDIAAGTFAEDSAGEFGEVGEFGAA